MGVTNWQGRLHHIKKMVPFMGDQKNIVHVFDEVGGPSEDVLLQQKKEFSKLCEFIYYQKVRSYLEIGVWTGRLIFSLDYIFTFDRVYAADIMYAQHSLGLPLHLPRGTHFFAGNSHSEEFKEWRQSIGHVDLVFIDASHRYEDVKRDYEIALNYPCRFIAFHDIACPLESNKGVGRLWNEIKEGACEPIEIVHPAKELGLGLSLMGIGIIKVRER